MANGVRHARFLLLLLSLSLPLPSAAPAAVIPAASGASADVQAAVDSAIDGDVISIPAGTYVWTTRPHTINGKDAAAVYVNKAVTLLGTDNKTVVIDSTNNEWDHVLIWMQTEKAKLYRVSGMSFLRQDKVPVGTAIYVTGSTKTFRVDHNTFRYNGNHGGLPVKVGGIFICGLIDHNTFKSDLGFQVSNVHWNKNSGDTYGGGTFAWEVPLSLGTADAVYLEDNVIDMGIARPETEKVLGNIDVELGGRYVLRHNTIRNNYAMMHGPGQSSGRGAASTEIYENTFLCDLEEEVYNPIWIRGGTSVIFSNTVRGYVDNAIDLDYPRTCCGSGTVCNGAYPINDRCDGKSPVDGNTEGMKGYPCMDQPGRGPGGPLGAQKAEPLYEWNNRMPSGTDVDFKVVNVTTCSSPSNADHIKAGRDFFNDTRRPGYTPFTYPHPLTLGALPLLNPSSSISGQSPPPQ